MTDSFHRSLLISVGIVVLVPLLFSAIFSFLAGRIRSENEKIRVDRVLMERQAQLLKLVAEFKTVAPEVALYQEQMDLLLPPKERLLEFAPWIERLGEINRVATTFVFNGEAVSSDGERPGYARFSLVVYGPGENVVNFFKEAEVRSKRFLLAFDNLNVSEEGEARRITTGGRVFFR